MYHLTKVYYHRDFLELARPRNINPCFIEDSSIYMKTRDAVSFKCRFKFCNVDYVENTKFLTLKDPLQAKNEILEIYSLR